MYIPNTMPITATEMYDFLEPAIEDGIFDTITIVDIGSALSGKGLECTQNGNTILTIWCDIADGVGQWYFIPHPASGINPDGSASESVRSVGITVSNTEGAWCFMRCKGGYGFMYWMPSSSYTIAAMFFIAKGSNGKTAFLSHGDYSQYYGYRDSHNQTLSATLVSGTMFPIQFGDNTNLDIWNKGILTNCNAVSADRTILQQIPIVGERGSTAYFTTLFVRTAVQEPVHGRQLLGDHYYGCLSNFAILDD